MRRSLLAGLIAFALAALAYTCGLGVMVVTSTRPEVSTQPLDAAEARAVIERLGLTEEYPFEHGFVDTPHGRMHYAAAGAGDPILCVHGNPTWSFLYRHLLRGLSETHRVIAVDLIGFGLSEKLARPGDYTIDGHVEDVAALIEALDLRDLTVVVQDWGGPIGVGAALRHPERVRGLVAMNTLAFVPEGMDDSSLPLPLAMLRVPVLGEQLVQGFGVFNRVYAPRAITPERRTEAVRRAYDAVQGNWEERAATLAFPRLYPDDADDPVVALLREEDRFLRAFDGRVLLVWGLRDKVFPEALLEEWKARFPRAPVLALRDAGHFPQEDAPEELVLWLSQQLDGHTS